MGNAKQATKERTCQVCKQIIVATAKKIKTHAAACKGEQSNG